MPVKVEVIKNRIHVTAPYRITRLSEAVPGANFVKKPEPHWTAPLTMSSCLALREKFGASMEIGPALTAWARAEKARSSRLGTLAKADDAELFLVPQRAPRLAEAVARRTYQRVGARFIAEGRNVLVADQPGLGKTLEALAGLVESGVTGDVLIFCPKTAIQSVWQPEIKRWLPGAVVLAMPEGGARRRKLLDQWSAAKVFQAQPTRLSFVVANIEMARTKSFWTCGECREKTPATARRKELKCGHDPRGAGRVDEHEYPQLFDREWAAIVADESQNALVRSSGIDTQTRQGMVLLRTQKDGLRMALSGTPFRSRPHLLWGTLNWLRPEAYTSMWTWVDTYFHVNADLYGKTIGGIRSEMEEALWRSLDPMMLRRTKDEVATDLPPKQYVGEEHPLGAGVWLEMLPAQAKAYKQMLDTSVAVLASGELSAVGILAEMTRLKQFAVTHGDMELRKRRERCQTLSHCPRGPEPHMHDVEEDAFLPSLPSNKFDYLVQLLEERGFFDGAPSTKIVVASQFTQTLELFAEELSSKLDAGQIVSITGQVTGARRKQALDAFNRPVGEGPHLMFLNTKAGGVAITIDSADEMVILDETWVPDDQEQLEDRIHRVSNPRPVWYHYLRSLGSIEEAIAEVARTRDEASKRLLDGRRGVEYGQKVLTEARKLVNR